MAGVICKSIHQMKPTVFLLFLQMCSAFASESCETPRLSKAIVMNNAPAVARMLAIGDSPDKRDCQGKTPTMLAVLGGNANILDLILEHKPSLWFTDRDYGYGETALIYAVRYHPEMITRLLNAGADPNVKSFYGDFTPLSWAVTKDRFDLVRELVEHHADINLWINGDTSFSLALCSLGMNYDCVYHPEIFKYFMQFNPNPNVRVRTAWRGDLWMVQAAYHRDRRAFKELVRVGANLEVLNSDGLSLLQDASREGEVNAVEELLDLGASPCSLNDGRYNGLIYWIARGNSGGILDRMIGACRSLLNNQTVAGETALHIAVWADNYAAAAELIENGIDMNLQDYRERTALRLAKELHRDEIARLIFEHGGH